MSIFKTVLRAAFPTLLAAILSVSCNYWTASIDKDYPYGAWTYTYGYDGGGMVSYQRFAGMSVRPVLE